MKSVLHLMDTYLPIPNTFIYNQVKHLKEYNGLFLVNKVENLNNFPYDRSKIKRFPFLFLKNQFYFINNYKRELLFNITFAPFNRIMNSYVLKDLKKWISKNEVFLLHADFGTNAIAFQNFKKKLNLPLITYFYGYDVSVIQRNRPGFYNKLFKNGDLFLTESEFLASKLREMGCPNNKLEVLRFGIDLTKFKFKVKKKSKKIKILSVGRLVEKKGMEYAIKAFSIAFKKHKNIEFRIIGEGPLRKRLEFIIKQNNLNGNVKLLGAQPSSRVVKEMLECHIFMMPSITSKEGDTEGQGVVFLEAQASGMPILSTYHNGIPEAVIHKKSGLLCNEKDYEKLGENLIYLIENPKEWIKMGKFGRKNVEKNFEIKKQTIELEKIYSRFN
ncbi:MAG: glycosyltransferase [Candidatus Nanoarchaeia archaeon]|nr:glycosyltransferase [Candidatus Nanoarchaeia archaeon]